MRLGDDVRIFVRAWPRMPVFVGTAVCVLALGIGATAVAFNFLDAILLRPSPVRDLDRLVSVWTRDPGHRELTESSYPAYLDWREQGRAVFDDVATMGSINFAYRLVRGGEAVRLQGRVVSDTFFAVLGATPLLGRTLTAADNQPGAKDLVLVMSWGLWQRQFAGDPAVVGSVITLDGSDAVPGRAFTVVGIMPRDFQYPAATEVWIPIVPGHAKLATDRGVGWLETVARVRAGVPHERARQAATAIARRNMPPGGPIVDAIFVPLERSLFGPSRPALVALMAAALLLLLIACANVGHLLLVRQTRGRRELAVREALGASRGQLARQQFAEALSLAIAGGLVGLLIATWTVKALLPFVPIEVPGLHRVGMSARTIAVAGLVSLLTAGIISLVPLLLSSGLFSSRIFSSAETRRGRRVRRVLMLSQVALAMVVLVGTGLLVRSFMAIRFVDLGFNPSRVVKLDVDLDDAHYDALLARVRSLRGVQAAGAVYLAPLEFGPIGMDAPFIVEGQATTRQAFDANPPVNWEAATPGYFEALGLPLVQGRLFNERDTVNSPAVVIVSEGLARYLSPDGQAIGRRLQTIDGPKDASGKPVWQTVVGIVKDARYRELTRPRLDLYLPHTQAYAPVRHLVVRANDDDPLALVAPIRELVRAIDPAVGVDGIVLLEDVVAKARASWTFNALVFTVFGGLSLLLVAVGLFGLLAYAVATRTREIGIRMALGAPRRDILRAMLAEGVTMTTVGIVLGLAIAWAGVQALESLLFGVAPRDTLTFVSASALVLLVCATASWIPARAALSVTPLIALRRE